MLRSDIEVIDQIIGSKWAKMIQELLHSLTRDAVLQVMRANHLDVARVLKLGIEKRVPSDLNTNPGT